MANRHFWYTALLYLYRPNLINKRLIGAKLIKIWICPYRKLDDIVIFLEQRNTTIEYLNSFLTICNSLGPNNFLDHLLNQQNNTILVLRKIFPKQSLKSLTTESKCNNIEYDWVILLPEVNTFAILPVDAYDGDGDENSGHVHINIRKNDIAFALCLIDGTQANFRIELRYLFGQEQQQQVMSKNRYLIENIFKPKFERWLKGSESSQDDNTATTTTTKMMFEGSIRNVSVETYCQNYNRLKEKYVSSLINVWSKVEKTDPIKFIYEDVAIAAYLITLWQEEMEKFSLNRRQTFADIGCGNGLLVFILTKEGYNGYGIDVRKRNIWNFYGNDINLIEMKIDLFNRNVDDDFQLAPCDWMIGNHSDELTPWIIYMAASVSPFTRAFILPCCCYDFDGFKFQRTTEPNKSQYQCYIDFLHRLCHQFGFKCFRDKLRIPSTKRICLVCYDRTYLDNGNYLANKNEDDNNKNNNNNNSNTWKTLTEEEQTKILRSIEIKWQYQRRQIVQQSLKSRSSHRLREKDEMVRNCTHIDQNIKQKIINILASAIFEREKNNSAPSIQDVIHLLDDDIRKHLKNQCGGLQTFIRNHKHIFTIVDNGIRFQSVEYLRKKNTSNEIRSKRKDCWFFRNHPFGCPLDEDQCSYRH